MDKELFLSDENGICDEDYQERKLIAEEFEKMPMEFFSKMRHFQPQIGCLNACSICSKFAGTTVAYWNERRIRNVVAGVKKVCKKYRKYAPFIVWDRNEHRNGVIFSYLDNDVGNYYYLDKFMRIVYDELGVKTRISTVGFSRHNKDIRNMHIRINNDAMVECLGGVRLSFTPYEIGWEKGDNSSQFSREEYMEDMAEFLKIYKPYYSKVGAGSRKMCVELRYKPLAIRANVIIKKYNGHFVIAVGNYLYISCEREINFLESRISDPSDHTIKLTEKPKLFFCINSKSIIRRERDLDDIMKKYSCLYKENIVEVYMLKNSEGVYYSINPSISAKGNDGINIYPQTEYRNQSGYLITERFFLNALYEYKNSLGIKIMDNFENSSWIDVDNVIKICQKNASEYAKNDKKEKASYITEEIIPMIVAYVTSLRKAGYKPRDVFDPSFTIDTGIICNMGRAIYEFNGLTQKINEPLTPTHERNYGHHNSTMTKEGVAWRLSCSYNDELIVEKLNLKDTSLKCGQIATQYKIKLRALDESMDISYLKTNYLVPGQIRNSCKTE